MPMRCAASAVESGGASCWLRAGSKTARALLSRIPAKNGPRQRIPRQRGANLLRRLAASIPAVAVLLCLAGCQAVGFYTQAAVGHMQLMLGRRSVESVLADPDTPPAVAERLRLVGALLDFAERDLALPADGRYRSYVELPRAAPVWIVVAAPEFDLSPLTHCYPVAGCVPYRGYFSERAARAAAGRMADGLDIHVSPAAAYSTLGWFDDPVLSSFLHYGDADLAELIFHELAHGKIYVPGDSAFNESFAQFVGERGALRWLRRNGGERVDAYMQSLAAQQAFRRFLRHWREQLAQLYAQPLGAAEKRRRKAETLAAMRRDYEMRRQALGAGSYDGAMARPFNNARFAIAAVYQEPALPFEDIFRAAGGDWPRFYDRVRALAAPLQARRGR